MPWGGAEKKVPERVTSGSKSSMVKVSVKRGQGFQWVVDISLGLLTPLEHEEIGTCQGKPWTENRELHARTGTIPIRVEK